MTRTKESTQLLYENFGDHFEYENFEFIDSFEIEGNGLKFPPKTLIFRNCSFTTVSIMTDGLNNIKFIDCNVERYFQTVEYSMSEILFENSEVYELSVATSGNGAIEFITIQNSNIEQSIFSGGILNIHVQNSKRNKIASMQSLKSANIEIKESYFDKLLISGTVKHLKIDQIISKEIEIAKVTGHVITIRKISNVPIKFLDTQSHEITLHESTNARVSFAGVDAKSICLVGGIYDEVKFIGNGKLQLKPLKESIPTFPKKDVIIKDFILEDFYLHENCSMMLLQMEIENLRILSSENRGTIRVVNSVVKRELQFIEAYLGKTTLNNVSLAPNCKVTFLDSDVGSVIFDNFRWNEKYLLDHADEKKNLPKLRESYRQLKGNYLKNNNKIEALQFQRHELKIHYKIVKEKMTKDFFTNIGDFFVLWTHKKVSSFGMNVWWPLGLLLSFHFILFTWFNCSSLHFQPNILDPNWSDTKVAFNTYFSTLLPTHGATVVLSDITKPSGTVTIPIPGAIDFFMRLFSGYFIFYFISATRKFHQ